MLFWKLALAIFDAILDILLFGAILLFAAIIFSVVALGLIALFL